MSRLIGNAQQRYIFYYRQMMSLSCLEHTSQFPTQSAVITVDLFSLHDFFLFSVLFLPRLRLGIIQSSEIRNGLCGRKYEIFAAYSERTYNLLRMGYYAYVKPEEVLNI